MNAFRAPLPVRPLLRVLAAIMLVISVPLACRTAPPPADRASAPEAHRPSEPEPERPPDTWTENEGPSLSDRELAEVTVLVPSRWTEKAEAYALFAGRVHRYSDDPRNRTGLGRFVELEHETQLDTGSGAQESRFYTVYTGLTGILVEPEERVSSGDAIGTTEEPSPDVDADTGDEPGVRIGVYTASDDPLWRSQTKAAPITVDGYYFWDPTFVLSPP
ncbi:MAG: hypothetical protein ACLFUX_09375 [Spirochaetaceae bacterium]